jgi:hypothetical protein
MDKILTCAMPCQQNVQKKEKKPAWRCIIQPIAEACGIITNDYQLSSG